ncbi:hypothetical protein BDV23DRAFT_188534 [Aspergillus alliaceus]|nr:hypothetical protein BDV23DRAFT_188534 [Aspergillus alliaceus]
MESQIPPDNTLSSTVQFAEHLISQLSECATKPENSCSAESQLPLSVTSAHVSKLKPLMITLHCLFPNELLLALDILDRGLVRCFRKENPNATEPSPTPNCRPPLPEDMFFVISLSTAPFMTSTSMSSRPHADQKGYEARLQAWNCTCPTFTLAAFRDLGADLAEDDPSSDGIPQSSCASGRHCPPFGGSLTRRPAKWSPPVCKHLLACLLMVRCPTLFGAPNNDCNRIVISAEELAGWCAGWGG